MKKLTNWDNKTWLSSREYIKQFNYFLKSKIKFNKNTQILDIGCGRANIISSLQNEYKFKIKPIGIDVVKNKNIKKNIIFYKSDIFQFLKKTNKKFDFILIKQTIHFFDNKKIRLLLSQLKLRLHKRGQILILTLKTKNNKIPCFKKMKIKLDKSLKKDEIIFKIIKKNLSKSKESYFNFIVNISMKKYLSMIKERYISCLLSFNSKELKLGIKEINGKFRGRIKFNDVLRCVSYRK
jgi:ubiquinone/menaquinone biosynthesis C-methylase UbiE